MKEERFKELFQCYVSRSCTSQEEIELMQMMNDPALDEIKKMQVEQVYDQLPDQELMTDAQADLIFNRILGKRATVVSFQPNRQYIFRRIAIAASVIFVIGISIWYIYYNKPAKQTEVVKTILPNDVKAPANNRAMITLSNGNKVYLDSASNGQLAVQNNIKVVKLADGRIAYQSTGQEATKEVIYNTLLNPRGSPSAVLILIDGTEVWLNAESSLKYFTNIPGGERKVEITGECYFEVAHNASKKFIVKDANSGTEIQVLGTHFNVNTYADEPEMKVTLLEGSVKVKAIGEGETSEVVIRPGEQAVAAKDGQLTINNNVNMEQVMSWKNGDFNFQDLSFPQVGRQLERWYDIEVVYKNKVPDIQFKGDMDRGVNLSEVRELFRAWGIKARIEGKKLIIE